MKQLLATSLALAGFALVQPAWALNILLTNDDGCRAPVSMPCTRRESAPAPPA